MLNSRILATTALAALSLLLNTGGCAFELSSILPEFNTVTVEIVNDTDYAVDPEIQYDDDNNFLADWFPSETLSTGLIEAGETASFRFDCDDLGLILSNEAEQVIPLFADYVADASDTLKRGDEYDCGDTIRFRFLGNGIDFGVIVSVNGRIVSD